MKLRKVIHKAQASPTHIPRLLTLCAFFAVGIVCGQLARHGAPGGELAEYLRSYAGMVARDGVAQASLPRVAAAYLREPLIILLLGSCTFGAAAIPLVCAWQGFTLSFAVACFAESLGYDGVLLSLAAFGLRYAVVLPCTLMVAQWAFDKALRHLRGEPAPARQRWHLLACFAVLLLGAVLEMAIVPQLFTLALGRIT